MTAVYALVASLSAILSVILSPFGWLGSLIAAPFIASGTVVVVGAAVGFVRDVKTIAGK